MTNLLDTLVNFNGSVLRNTIWTGSKNKDNVFDDLSNNPDDWDQAESLCKKPLIQLTENEILYQAIEYVFDRENWFQSRFSNGNFPAWYGSLELNTTFYETGFHWRKVLLSDAGFFKIKNPIYALRTVFNIDCTSALVDIRSKTKDHPYLIGTNIKHYEETQALGLKLSTEGFPGLIALSARVSSGNNVIVFNKKILQNPKPENDYLYAIFPDNPAKIQIMRYNSREIILEI